jgi:hypothetical protein
MLKPDRLTVVNKKNPVLVGRILFVIYLKGGLREINLK